MLCYTAGGARSTPPFLAPMTKIPVPSLDSARYAETFAMFVARSLEYPQMIAELVAVTRTRCPERYRLLDIGAGTGLVIAGLLAAGGRRPTHYTAFEPNPRHAQALRSTLEELALPHAVREQPFSEHTVCDRTYDLALLSHSLYWMPDPAGTLLHAAAAVADSGMVLAFIGGPYGVHAMFHLFEPLLERSSPLLQDNALSSHELVMGLRTHGVEPQVRMLPTPIDLTGLFDPEASVELGEFIAFCMQVEFSALPAWLQQDMIDYIRGGCVRIGERLYWYLPTAAVTMPGRA